MGRQRQEKGGCVEEVVALALAHGRVGLSVLGLTFAVGAGEHEWSDPGDSSKLEQTSSVDQEGLSELEWDQVGMEAGGQLEVGTVQKWGQHKVVQYALWCFVGNEELLQVSYS